MTIILIIALGISIALNFVSVRKWILAKKAKAEALAEGLLKK